MLQQLPLEPVLLLPECLLFRWGGRGRDEIDVGSQGCLCVLCSDGRGNSQNGDDGDAEKILHGSFFNEEKVCCVSAKVTRVVREAGEKM